MMPTAMGGLTRPPSALTWRTLTPPGRRVPLYVVLVGDGSFDPRQYRADSPPTFIPPYLADVDPWAGETAADNRYVDGGWARYAAGYADWPPAGQNIGRDASRGG